MSKTFIVPPIYHRHLYEKKRNDYFQSFLISLLMYDEATVYEYLLNEPSFKVYEKLKKEGYAKEVPFKYLSNSINVLEDLLDCEMKFRYLQRQKLNFQLSYENIENRKYYKYLEKQDDEYDIEMDNLFYKIKQYNKKIKNTFNFINVYRKTKIKISKNIYTDFCWLNSVENFINSLESLLDMERYAIKNEGKKTFNFNSIKEMFYSHYEEFKEDLNYIIERQKNFTFLVGLSDDYVDKEPSKVYLNSYFDLIESTLLLDSAMEYSLSENATIILPYNSNITAINENLHESLSQNVNKDSFYQIYKMVIENIDFPVIDSISEMLRLREHKYIREFKKLFNEWNLALQEDEYSSLKSIKKYLEKANKKITFLEKTKRSSIDFYLAIPCAIVDLVFHTPLSIVPLAITSYFKINESVTKHKYKGLLIK